MSGELRSISKARITDVLSEGEVDSLIDAQGNRITLNSQLGKALFLDEAPLVDPLGQAAYENIKMSFTQGRRGLLQTRDQFLSQQINENFNANNTRLKTSIPWLSPAIPDHVEQVIFTFGVGALYTRDPNTGDLKNATIEYVIKTGETTGSLKTYGSAKRTLSGKATSSYAFEQTVLFGSHDVNYIQIERVNKEADITDDNLKNSLYLSGYSYIQNTKMSYAGTSTFQMEFDAENLQSIPSRAFRIRGVKVPLPTGYDGTKRLMSFYDEIWDGALDYGYDTAYSIVFNEAAIKTDETIYDILLTNPAYDPDPNNNASGTPDGSYDTVNHYVSMTMRWSDGTSSVLPLETDEPQILFRIPKTRGVTLLDHYGTWSRNRFSLNGGDDPDVETQEDDEITHFESGNIIPNTHTTVSSNDVSISLLDTNWIFSSNSASSIESNQAKIKPNTVSVVTVTMSRSYTQMSGIREGEFYTISGTYKPSNDGGVTCNFFSNEEIALADHHIEPPVNGFYDFSFTALAGNLPNFTFNVVCSDTGNGAAWFNNLTIKTANPRVNLAWTNNPAWIFYDLMTNQRYGLGKYLGDYFVDKWTLYKIARYCDERIDAGVGVVTISLTNNAGVTISDDIDTPTVLSIKAGGVLSMQVLKLYPDQPITINGTEYFLADYAYNGASSIKVYDRDANSASAEVITDNTVIQETVLEPRFTINTYIQKQEEAYKLMQNLASAFRAMVYWAGGMIQLAQDGPKLPIDEFTNANVIDGRFDYATAARKTRHTVALVRYADEMDMFKPKLEPVEDGESLFKYGYRPIEVAAFGASSRGQAKRLGQWLLYTENKEAQTVSFRAALQGAYLKPGDVVKVMDKNKSNRYFGGRVLSIDTTTPSTPILTLDKQWRQLDGLTYNFTATTPRANKEAEEVNISTDIDNIRKSQVTTFSVTAWSNGDDGTLGASDSFTYEGSPTDGRISNKVKLTGDLTDFEKIKKYTVWMIESPEEISAQQFRVVSIEEIKQNEFEIIGSKYVYAKFEDIEGGIAQPLLPVTNYPKLNVVAPVTNLNATLADKSNGLYGLHVSWTAPVGSFVSHYLIRWKIGDAPWSQQQRSDNPSYEIPYTPLIGKYAIQVVAVASPNGRLSAAKQISFGTDYVPTSYIQIAGGESYDYFQTANLTLVDGFGPSGTGFDTTTPTFTWTKDILRNRVTVPSDPFVKTSGVITWSAHDLIYQENVYPIDANATGFDDGEFINWPIGDTAYQVTVGNPALDPNYNRNTNITFAQNYGGSFNFMQSPQLNNLSWLQDKVNFVDFQIDVAVSGSSYFSTNTTSYTYQFGETALKTALGGIRDFDVEVRARYLVHTGGEDQPIGYLGVPVSLSVTNPAPSIPTSITINPRGTVNELAFVPSNADADYAGSRVLIGNAATWAAVKDNAILDSNKTNKVAIDATEKDVYYTIASYDTWGKKHLNYSPWPPEILADQGAPNAPSNLVAAKQQDGLLLTWDHTTPSKDIEGYEIWKCPNDSLHGSNFEEIYTSPVTLADAEAQLVEYIVDEDIRKRLIAGYNPLATEYYWIRAVDTSKNKSYFEPAPTSGLEVGAESLDITASADSFIRNEVGDLESSPSYITLTGVKNNFSSALTWSVTNSIPLRTGIDIGDPTTTTGDVVYLHWGDVEAADVSAFTVSVYKSDNSSINDAKTIYVLTNTASSVVAWLTNQSHTYSADTDGIIISGDYPDGKTLVQVFKGVTELEYVPGTTTAGEYKISANVTSGTISLTTGTEAGTPDRAYIVPVTDSFTSNSALIDVDITYYYKDSGGATQNATTTRKLNYSKSKSGTQPSLLQIITSGHTFSANQDGVIIDPPYIVLDTEKQSVGESVIWKATNGTLYENKVNDWNLEGGYSNWGTDAGCSVQTDGAHSYDGDNYIKMSDYGDSCAAYVNNNTSIFTGLIEGDVIFVAARCYKPTGGTFLVFGPRIRLLSAGEGALFTRTTGLMWGDHATMPNDTWTNVYGSYTITAADITAGVDRARVDVAIYNQNAYDFYVDSAIAFKTSDNASTLTTENSVVLYSGNFNVENVEITATST